MRTQTIEDAGKTPVWNETFDLNVRQINDDILLRVMDENVNANTEIGTCSLKLAALCVNGGLENWWPISFGPKQAGRIHMIAEWFPAGSDPVSVSAAAMPGQQTVVHQMMLAKTMEGRKPNPPPAYNMPAYNYQEPNRMQAP